MTIAQQQFQKDKELYEKWLAICVTDDFQKVLGHCRASILESGGLNPDMIYGVNLLATTLVSITDTQEPKPLWVSTGLRHDLDVPRKTPDKKDK